MELTGKTGLLILTWENKEEKERLYPLLEKILKTRHGEPLEIRPKHTSIYKVPYPPPRDFDVPFCKKAVHYIAETVPNPLRDLMIAIEEIQHEVENQFALPKLPKFTEP